MPQAESLTLRIDGFECKRVGLQYKLKGDRPIGPLEVIIKEDLLGHFALTDEFLIEVREGDRDWQKITLAKLITLLQGYAE